MMDDRSGRSERGRRALTDLIYGNVTRAERRRIARPTRSFPIRGKADDTARLSRRAFFPPYRSEAVAIHGGSVCAGRVFYCPKTDRYQDYVLRRGRDCGGAASEREGGRETDTMDVGWNAMRAEGANPREKGKDITA